MNAVAAGIGKPGAGFRTSVADALMMRPNGLGKPGAGQPRFMRALATAHKRAVHAGACDSPQKKRAASEGAAPFHPAPQRVGEHTLRTLAEMRTVVTSACG